MTAWLVAVLGGLLGLGWVLAMHERKDIAERRARHREWVRQARSAAQPDRCLTER